MTYSKTEATVDFPYEYLPLPRKGDTVDAVNRAGERVCAARVLELRRSPGYDGTAVIRLAIPKEQAGEVRSMRRLKGNLES